MKLTFLVLDWEMSLHWRCHLLEWHLLLELQAVELPLSEALFRVPATVHTQGTKLLLLLHLILITWV